MKFLMRKYLFKYVLFIGTVFTLSGCSENDAANTPLPPTNETKELTIFHINDMHGSIDNFSKIKYLLDEERSTSNVLFVCGGDTFSGNPVVDNYNEKGFPMIDLMNKTSMDVAAIGNHEFDYGEAVLKDRLNQSNFDWLCANIDTKNSSISQPKAFKTIDVNGIKVTVLGLIQTKETDNGTIPSTHPWRVENFIFTDYSEVITEYSNIKNTENADLYVALSHLGENSDVSIATKHPYFDMIIGGHSHSSTNKKVNGTYIYQAGSNLNYLGKIVISINKEGVIDAAHELIDLSKITKFNEVIQSDIDTYNNNPKLDKVIGYSEEYHNRNEVGNFYTTALLEELDADLTFQNSGGIRNILDEGDITVREIYSIDPFNNGSVTYDMTIGEIKYFLMDSRAGVHYAGLTIEQSGNTILLKNEAGDILNDNVTITIGINDYIPAVYKNYFTATPSIKEFTTAETIINYLNNNPESINYTNYSSYFKYE